MSDHARIEALERELFSLQQSLETAKGEREQWREHIVDAYYKAQSHWSAQCFCFTSAPESLRRGAHEAARDGFNELVQAIGPLARPIIDAEYKAAEAEAKSAALRVQ